MIPAIWVPWPSPSVGNVDESFAAYAWQGEARHCPHVDMGAMREVKSGWLY